MNRPSRWRTIGTVSAVVVAFSAITTGVSSAEVRSAAPGPANAAATSEKWPADSLYHLDIAVQTSDGGNTRFAANEGRARLVSMFYATCPMACPLTFETVRNVERALTPAERARLGILLVTVDPARDTPAALHALARERHVDEKRWTLGRVSAPDTRKLAAALGVQYRQREDGEFDHSSVLILLDAKGRVLARSAKLGVPEAALIEAIRKATAVLELDGTPTAGLLRRRS